MSEVCLRPSSESFERAPLLNEAAFSLHTSDFQVYSYRNASIGSRRDALNAGHIPKKIPTDAEKPRPIANDHHGSEMGKPDTRWTVQPMALPRPMPSSPPIDVRNAASIRNWNRISARRAPSALRTPISRVRSVTEIDMIAITPIPPTISAIDEITTRAKNVPWLI